MKLIIKKDGLYNISLLQTDERCFERSDDYDYSNAKFILSRIVSEEEGKVELEYHGGCMGV